MNDYFANRPLCQQCLETGFMTIFINNHAVLICCQCDSFGKPASQKFGVKQWKYDEHKVFRTEPLEAHWFKPNQGEDKLWMWRKMIEHAIEFWKESKTQQLGGHQ